MFNVLCVRANLCELAGASNYDVLLNVYGILQMRGNYFANQLVFGSLSFGLHHNQILGLEHFLQLLLLPIMIMSQFSSLFYLMVLLGCKLQCKMIFKKIILQAAAQLFFLTLYLFYFGVQYFTVLLFLIAVASLFSVTNRLQPIARVSFYLFSKKFQQPKALTK